MSNIVIMLCTHCGKDFKPKYENSKLCYHCWKLRENIFEQHDYLMNKIVELQTIINNLQTKPKIPPEFLIRLIRLCHPDKHGNSQMSNEITKWLLEQRV